MPHRLWTSRRQLQALYGGRSFGESRVALFTENLGSFGGTPIFVSLLGQHPNGLAIGRVAGQSTPLIVVADRDSDEIDLLGLGSDGTYKVLKSFSVKVGQGEDSQYGPVEIAIGDFSGSGYLGFASSHMRGGLVHVFSQESPAAPQISSSSDPDSAQYYSGNQAQFTWTTPSDFDGIDHYQYALDQSNTLQPSGKTQSTGANSANFSGLSTGTYYLHVSAVDKAGDMGLPALYKIGVTAAMSPDNTYNFPNPSTTGQTTIRFALDTPQAVQIRIYDEVSSLVWSKDLGAGETIAGVNYVQWNGVNDRGVTVGNGGYILQVKSGNIVVTKKIAIVR